MFKKFLWQSAVASVALTFTAITLAGASSLVVRKNIGESFGTAIAQSVSFLKDLSDVSDSLSPSNGQVLTFSGGQWTSASPGSFSENDTLADVTGRGATTTATITATGFIGSGAGLTGLPAPTNGASLTSLPNEVLTLNGLSGVTLTSPASGQILSFDGTNWVNSNNAASPPTCNGARQALQWTGSVWNCATILSTTEENALSNLATLRTSGSGFIKAGSGNLTAATAFSEIDVQTCSSGSSGSYNGCTATCQSGWTVIAGGCSHSPYPLDFGIAQSAPSGTTQWSCTVNRDDPNSNNAAAVDYAICVR